MKNKVRPKRNPKGKNARKQEIQNFHGSISFVLVIVHYLGGFPVEGVSEADHRRLRFKWVSWTVLCYLLMLGAQAFTVLWETVALLAYPWNLFTTLPIVIRLNSLIAGGMILRLCKQWPELINEWHDVDISMRKYGWPPGLQRKCTTTVALFLIFGLIQIPVSGGIQLYILQQNTHSFHHTMQYYLELMLVRCSFSMMSVPRWIGIFVMILNSNSFFLWLFFDVLLILLSISLAERFKQIGNRLDYYVEMRMTGIWSWRITREDYTNLCFLCKRVNREISLMIFWSYASNLFLILIQIFIAIKGINGVHATINLTTSFLFIVLRMVSVSLSGSQIYEEARKPIIILNKLPTEYYNLEVRRLLHQINFDDVVLTGNGFFRVTRSLLLSIAGAIISYELVLIPLNEHHLQPDYLLNFTNIKC